MAVVRAAVACTLAAAAGCAEPAEVVFVVDGFSDVAVPPSASMITLWFVSSGEADYVYKFGDGIRLGAQFTAGYETVPPPEALSDDGRERTTPICNWR